QLAGRHKGGLVIGFQDIVGDPLLSLGKSIHIFVDQRQNIPIHLQSSPDGAPEAGAILSFLPYDNGFQQKMQVNFAGFSPSLAKSPCIFVKSSIFHPEASVPPPSGAATDPASGSGPARGLPPGCA